MMETENKLYPVRQTKQKRGVEKFSPVISGHPVFSPITSVTYPDSNSIVSTWELFLSCKAEPVRLWIELEEEKYDWSYTAMRYWPQRVRAACKRNKSYAITHGLEEEYERLN